ncbi:hypothetical protein LMG19089_02890 [Ralstonia edaphis]|uniref:hypothetical protein n=1 Tax=Ralstonia edaphi TaxID=3058599 RepID=UPI0028F5FFD9|nr:hypothetical protein [Ralstonia sp. LMG 6871]CAJ0701645.1 hypothetical protein LMG19089_02890 [Ralstonia sp. LMG 6871]
MYGIVANVLSDRVLRTGARVWISRCNGDAVCPIVIGLSKGGRRVRKFTNYKRLAKFRAAWIPERLRGEVCWQWAEKHDAAEAAQKLSSLWAGVRFFSRDGSVLLAAALLGACKTLPEGYSILLDVENGWGGVKLIDSNGDGVDYDNGESSLTEQVIEATKTAIAYAGKEARHG